MTYEAFLAKMMENPEFKAEWERTQPEADIVLSILEARYQARLTQKELSEKSGVAQSDISKIESGRGNPTLKMLMRLAQAMDCHLELKFVPN